MKKKIIIPIIVVIILVVIGIVVGGLFFLKKEPKEYKVILEMNPSLQINFDKKQVVQSVVPLNEDAKKVLPKNPEGQNIFESIQEIVNNICEEGFIEGNEAFFLLYTDNDELRERLRKSVFPSIETDLYVETYLVKEITEEDEKLAKKYKISKMKAAFINQTLKERKNFNFEYFVDRDFREIHETQETGYYCEEGYSLRGVFCNKPVEEKEPVVEKQCPRRAIEIDGVCYKEGEMKESTKDICPEGFTKDKDTCYRDETYEAEGVCSEGEYEGHDSCVVRTKVEAVKEYCRITPESDMLIDHKCYGPKPMINGGCLNGDSVVSGWCIDYNSYYEAEIMCPDGHLIPQGQECVEEKHTAPSSYRCNTGDKLDGKTCINHREEHMIKEMICLNGSEKYGYNDCVDKTQTVDKVDTYTCPYPDSELRGDKCVLLERKDALIK